MADDDTLKIKVGAETYTLDDLTFREQIKLRKLVGEIVPGEEDDPPLAAVIPAAVALLHQRTDDSFTLEQALDLNWNDLTSNGSNGTGNGRPTKRKATKAPAKSS